MAYMPYPLQHSNFLLSTTVQSRPTPSASHTMYGGRSPTEEPDNIILHEPWEMPPNAAPNHCAPGCSILLHSEEESGRGRRFNIMGRRRNSRSSSFSSVTKSGRRSVSEGTSGGKLANLFESNPFSFDSGPPAKASDIKSGSAKSEEEDGRSTPTLPESRSRECSLRFGELPHRPPELRRASSISIGVLTRSSMLSEQKGAGTPPRQAPYVKSGVNSTEPEPVDLGEAVKHGAKNLWQNLRSSFSGSSPTSHESPQTTRASFSAYIDSSRRASGSAAGPTSPSARAHAQHTPSPLQTHPSPLARPVSGADAVHPLTPTDDFSNYSLIAPSLSAVKEEPGSGAATPISGPGGSSLDLEKLRIDTNYAQATHEKRDHAPPSLSSTIYPISTQMEPTIKHPDATRRPPSPPPRQEDRKGFVEDVDQVDDEEGDVEALYGTPPESAADPTPMVQRRRRSSQGEDGTEASGVDRADRESRGESREATILGFQR